MTLVMVVAMLAIAWLLQKAMGGEFDLLQAVGLVSATVMVTLSAIYAGGWSVIGCQDWVVVEAVEEEDLGEAIEWSTEDELKDLRELVEWKANQMSELQHYLDERVDELAQKLEEVSDLQDDRFQDLQDNIDILTGKLLQKDAKWQDLYGTYDEDGLPVIQATPK